MGQKFYVFQTSILNNYVDIIELEADNIDDAYDEMEEVSGNSTREILLTEEMLDKLVHKGLKLIDKGGK